MARAIDHPPRLPRAVVLPAPARVCLKACASLSEAFKKAIPTATVPSPEMAVNWVSDRKALANAGTFPAASTVVSVLVLIL